MLLCSGSALGAGLEPQASAEIRQVTGALSLAPLFVTHDEQREGVTHIGDSDVASPHGERDGRAARRVLVDLPLLAAARDVVLDSAVARVRFNLFEDVDLDVVFERTADTRFGYSLSGRIEGDPLGSVTFVVNGDLVAGAVHSKAGAFVIGSRNGAVHTVEEMVDDLPISDEVADLRGLPVSRKGPAAQGRPATVREDDGSELDVLILFTESALRAERGLGRMQTSIALAVAYTNDAFRASGVDLRLRLVAAVPVGYRESTLHGRAGVWNQAVDRARLVALGDGFVDEAHELRERYAADLVHLIVHQPGGGRTANHLEAGAEDPSAWAFSVSNSLSLPAFLVGIAGNALGVGVDRYHALVGTPRPDYPPYAHGYVNQRAFEPGAPVESRWFTMMATASQCRDSDISCRRLQRFSTPNQTYPTDGGDALGVPGDRDTDDVDGPADAVRRINETRQLVAGFRQSALRCDYTLSASGVRTRRRRASQSCLPDAQALGT